MNKDQIILEIQRTAKANGGVPLGYERFEAETGIRRHEWCGQFWARWGDAVREAGFEPNRMSEAYDEDFLVEKLVAVTRKINKVPTFNEIKLLRKGDPTLPAIGAFQRLGSELVRISKVMAYCESHPDNNDVANLWKTVTFTQRTSDAANDGLSPTAPGYVYLLKHGSRREYKIGRTINPLRREGELGIQLPEQLKPVHYIETDDPAGVENYWHARFASKRKLGEWFALSVADVRAFKRWKRIY